MTVQSAECKVQSGKTAVRSCYLPFILHSALCTLHWMS
jgi:hypothetical protein